MTTIDANNNQTMFKTNAITQELREYNDHLQMIHNCHINSC